MPNGDLEVDACVLRYMGQVDEGFDRAANRPGFKFSRQLSEPAHKTVKPIKPILKKTRSEPVKRLSALLAAHLPGRRKSDVTTPLSKKHSETRVPTARIQLTARDNIYVSNGRSSRPKQSSNTVPEAERELIWSPGWSKRSPDASPRESTQVKKKQAPRAPASVLSYTRDIPSDKSQRSINTIPFPSRPSSTSVPVQGHPPAASARPVKRGRLSSSVRTDWNWKETYDANPSLYFNTTPDEVRRARNVSRNTTPEDASTKRTKAPRRGRVSFTVPEGHREQPPAIHRRSTPYFLPPLHSKVLWILEPVLGVFRRRNTEERQKERERKQRETGKKAQKQIDELEGYFRRLNSP